MQLYTLTEVFIKLIKQDKDIDRKITSTDNVECNQYNIYKNKNICYTDNGLRDNCVVPINSKEE